MPRKPRLHLPGGLYHVILRGNGRQPIFFEDFDRRRWMGLLTDGIARHRCRIHAYCWMTNHVHLAIQVSDIPLGRLVGWAASQYAKAINKRLNRSGHLFERRYGAKLVDIDSYLLALVRYIHRNPVDAHLVEDAADYAWSSHRAYLGFDKPSLLTIDWVLSFLGQDPHEARQTYIRFMMEAEELPRELVNGHPDDQRLAGDDSFADRVSLQRKPSRQKPSLSELIEDICGAHDVSEAALASPVRSRKLARVRAEIGRIAQEQSIATVHEIAQRFNRTDSAISHGISRLLRQR